MENKKKIDFSKLKNLANMDLKDLTAKMKSNDNKSESKLKKLLNTKIEKPRNVVSFDIGTNSTKIVCGKHFKGRVTINKCINIKTPEGSVADGKIINKEVLCDVLKFTLDQNNVKAKDGICTTNSSLIINRDIVIPKVQPEEMDTVIRFEIQQYLPINLNDYVIQYTILDEIVEDTGVKLKVNVISFPERVAYSYYELLNGLNLNPYILDVTYNSLNKVANYSELTKGIKGLRGTVAFVDMGATSIDVTILKNGKLDFTRMIKSGGDNIDFALSHKLDVSIKSTESIKIKNGNLDHIKEDDIVNLTIKDIIDSILDDIERIIQFYKNKSSSGELDKIYIYGGTSNLVGMDKYIGNKFNIPTEKISNLINIDFITNELKETSMEQYLNAIGSIIRL